MDSTPTSQSTPREANAILQLQAKVLETLATGGRADAALNSLCLMVEQLVPGAVCSVMALADECLKVRTAPSAPEAMHRRSLCSMHRR